MTVGVYRIICTLSGDFYIGSSSVIEQRRKNHFKKLKSGTHPNQELQADYIKAKDWFKFEVIEECEDYLEREDWYIENWKPFYNGYTYREINITESNINLFKSNIKIEENGCWSYLGRKERRYTSICFNYIGYMFHRLSYLIFNGPFNKVKQILHSCNNKWCGNPEHLSVGTGKENSIAARSDGLGCKLNMKIAKYLRSIHSYECRAKDMIKIVKEKFGIIINKTSIDCVLRNTYFYDVNYKPVDYTQLTSEKVKEIRECYISGMISAEIARKFKIHETNVGQIVKNKSYYSSEYQTILDNFIESKNKGEIINDTKL